MEHPDVIALAQRFAEFEVRTRQLEERAGNLSREVAEQNRRLQALEASDDSTVEQSRAVTALRANHKALTRAGFDQNATWSQQANGIACLAADLEAERKAHKEARLRLTELKVELRGLKNSISVLIGTEEPPF